MKTKKCTGSGQRVIAKAINNPLGFCLKCRQRMMVGDLRGRWIPRIGLPDVPKLEGTLPKHDDRGEVARGRAATL